MGFFDWLKSEDQKKADRAAQTLREQRQNLADVTRDKLANGNANQKRAAQTVSNSKELNIQAVTRTAPKQSFSNKLSDVFDANSEMDKWKRSRLNQANLYEDQQRDNGIAGRSIASNPLERTFNTGRSIAEGFIEGPFTLARGAGNALGTQLPDYKTAERTEDINRNIVTQKRDEMFSILKDPNAPIDMKQRAIDFLNNVDGQSNSMQELRAKIASENDPRRLLAASAETLFDVATLGVAGGSKAGIKSAYQAGKATTGKVTTGLAAGSRKYAFDTAKTAGMGTVGGGLSPYVNDPNATFKQAVMGAGTGAVGGAVLPTAMIAGSSIVPTTKLVTKTVNKTLKDNNLIAPTRMNPAEVSDLAIWRDSMGGGRFVDDNVYFNGKRAAEIAGVDYRDPDAIDKVLNSHNTYDTTKAARQESIKNKVDTVKSIPKKIAELDKKQGQGGFVANPFYKDGTLRPGVDESRIFDGVDGKPRVEFSDEGATIRQPQNLKTYPEYKLAQTELGDILNHPLLYEQYPELKNAILTIDQNFSGKGVANGDRGIRIHPDLLKDPKQAKRVLLHEAQHLIQGRENFAKGGSPDDFKKFTGDSTTKKLIQQIKDLEERPAYKDMEYRANMASDSEFDNIIKQYESTPEGKTYRELTDKLNQYRQDKQPDAQYRKLAGEAEARAVEARINMTDGERYVTPKTKAGDYVGSHQAPTRGDGDYHAPASNVTGGGGMYPDDIYTDPQAYRYYGHGGDAKTIAMDKKSIELIRALKDRPDTEVTMYRAVPEGKASDINAGDWVTLNKEYAQQHNMSQFDGKGVILEKKVKADELYTDGNSIHEFGYDPRPKPQSTFYDSLDVPKEDLIIRNGNGKAMSKDLADTAKAKKAPVEKTPKIVYRGGEISDNIQGKGNLGSGAYFTTDKAQADNFAKGSSTIEASLPNGKYATRTDKISVGEMQNLNDKLKLGIDNTEIKNGDWGDNFVDFYEGVITPRLEGSSITQAKLGQIMEEVTGKVGISDDYHGATQYLIFNPDRVKTPKPTLQDALEGKNTKPSGNTRLSSQAQKPKLEQNKSPKLKVQTEGTAPKSQVRVEDQGLTNKSLSSANDTTEALNKQAYKDTFGVDDTTANKDLNSIANDDPLRKAIGNKPTKQQEKLIQGMKQDEIITKAAKEAQNSGKEFNFYGKMDDSGRSVGIENFNPKRHRIEAGLVIDEDGKVLGNHIKIDETGTAVNIGGNYTKMDDVFGDITKWKSQNKYTSTLERNIMEAAPDKETGRKVTKWIVGNKTKAERKWKDAIGTAVEKNDARYKSVVKNKPSGVSTKQVLADSMDYGEASLSKADLRAKYGKEYAKTITDAIDGMRGDYDRYIKDINDTRLRFGLEPIEPRKDYITHISELNNNKNFVGDLTTALKNSITGEAMERTRGGVPTDIAGRTEGFSPTTKWNQYLQRRQGGKYKKDPFKAFNEYVPNAEHNIHMTESITRARAAEEFLRARSNLAGLNDKNYGKLLNDELSLKVKGGPQDDKLVTLFQEYANALAGKTQKLDRAILDSPLRPGLKGWQGLQRIGGRATILGNVSSVMMQPLNQVNVFSTVKPKSFAKGMSRWLRNDKAINQSNFVQARIKHIDSTLRGKGQKFLDATGVPLRAVEEQSVKLAWYANYEDVLKKGIKGADAVLEADRMTERHVAGRGLADKPEAYRSTAINGGLQYTLEVMAQAKVFWKDLSTVQKAKWIAGAYAVNTGYGLIMNDRPLPDYIDAVIQGTGVSDPEDDRSVAEKAVNTAQRVAGETVKFNPITGKAAQMLPKNMKVAAFGSDSDLTRYDGTAAPVRTVQNAYKSAEAAVKGNVQEAISRGLRLVPTGNQVQKTGNSVVMNQRGYNVDKNGKPTFDAPTTTADKARSLLFGPYATDAAQDYYKEGTGSLSKNKTVNGKVIANTSKQTIDEAKANTWKRIENAFGKDYAKLNETELEELAKTDDNAKQAYQMLENTKGAFKKGIDTPSGLDKSASRVLNQADRTTNKDWGKMKNTDKSITETLKKWNNGIDLPVTNETAKAWANYEKKRVEGTLGKLEAEDEKKKILISAYNSQLNEDQRDLYKLSEARLKDAYSRNLINDSDLEKALAVEKQLYDAGLISKETLRRKLDLSARGYKGSKSSGGSKSSKSYKLSDILGGAVSANKTLRDIVEKYSK